MSSVKAKADVIDEKASDVKVYAKKQRKNEEGLDFVKENLHILFLTPRGENSKLNTDAGGQLRCWFEGRIYRRIFEIHLM